MVLSVRSDSPFKGLKDLVDTAKAKPRQVRVGATGVRSAADPTLMQLASVSGADFATV